MAGIEPVAGRQEVAEELPGGLLVHLRELVVDRHPRRQHVAHDHPLADMAGERAVLARRATGLEHPGQADELGDELLVLRGGEQLVAPVVDHRAGEHHPPDRAALVVLERILPVGPAQGVQAGLDRAAAQRAVGGEQVAQGIDHHPVLGVLPRQLLQVVPGGLEHRVGDPRFQVRQVAGAQVEAGVLPRRDRHLDPILQRGPGGIVRVVAAGGQGQDGQQGAAQQQQEDGLAHENLAGGGLERSGPGTRPPVSSPATVQAYTNAGRPEAERYFRSRPRALEGSSARRTGDPNCLRPRARFRSPPPGRRPDTPGSTAPAGG